MKKLLLIAIALTTVNAYAYDPYGDEMQHEYQQQELQNEQQALRNQQTQTMIDQSNEMSLEQRRYN